MTLTVDSPNPPFTDIDGSPLENGLIYIGVANTDPKVSPLAVFRNRGLNFAVTQPVRTRGGYPIDDNGDVCRLYTGTDYSIQVENQNGTVLFSSLFSDVYQYNGIIGSTTVAGTYALDIYAGDAVNKTTLSRTGLPLEQTELVHGGTGDLSIRTEDAAAIAFYTNNSLRGFLDSSGTFRFGGQTSGILSPNTLYVGSEQPSGAVATFVKASDTASPSVVVHRTRGTLALPTLLLSGDTIGGVFFQTSDGTTSVNTAGFSATLEASPAGSVFPSRLNFLTMNPSGTFTTRMVVNNLGAVGVGTTSLTAHNLRVAKTITGAASAFGITSDGQLQPDVITAGQMFRSVVTTANNGGVPYTIANVYHYLAQQSTIDPDSTITNHIGFLANSSMLTGTNVFGFRGDVVAATGRWNFYAAGTAANYFAGDTAVGTTVTTQARLTVRGSGTSSAANAVLAEDSAGVDLFTIRNDGGFAFKGGTVGLAQTGYSVTNVTTDRTYDANATTLDEIADVLGTLINDLRTKGIIST